MILMMQRDVCTGDSALDVRVRGGVTQGPVGLRGLHGLRCVVASRWPCSAVATHRDATRRPSRVRPAMRHLGVILSLTQSTCSFLRRIKSFQWNQVEPTF